MKITISLIIIIEVVFAGYPISVPFTDDTTHTVAYNLIDTDPSCYYRGYCPNFRPGGKLSTFPNSEEKYQHILHNMFRVFTNQSLEIKYGKWINGLDESGGRTNFSQNTGLRYCGRSNSWIKPLYWYSDANQAARFKQWDYNTCNKSWYSQPGNTKHFTCKWGEGVINNVPINRCELFGIQNDCLLADRSYAFCQEDRCWFETESSCSGNECLIGPQCEPIFASRYDYSGIGFINGYDDFTTVYSRFTREISYLLPSGAHFDERTKIVQEDYNEEGKHFTLWLQYFDVNNTQTVESCYSLYNGTFHAMNLLVGNRGSNGGDFHSAMFTSHHLPPSQCEPYAFICKTSLGNYFRLPEDSNYYFGTEWLDGNNSNHEDLGLECKENHYFFDDEESEWIVNGGPTLKKSNIWYYQDRINYGECIGCVHINALQCWSECIVNDFSEEFCSICMNAATTTSNPTEMPTELPTTDPTAFPTQMPKIYTTTIQPTVDPTAFPTSLPTLIRITATPTVDPTEILTTFDSTDMKTTIQTTIETTQVDKILCKGINDCDKQNGYRCEADSECRKGHTYCKNKQVCLKRYGQCSYNQDCEGDHQCGFRGMSPRGKCVQYQ